jgi:deazaflavin-dependent oxidoreductase (nitroreductase family)
MDDTIRRALQRRNIIDITTTGRRTGQPRRIEIVFHSFDGRTYISGMPSPRKRAWIANLEADPRLTFHFKGTIGTPVADLPAIARIITDEAERRAVFRQIIDTAWHQQDLETMVRQSPLIEVTFPEQLAA